MLSEKEDKLIKDNVSNFYHITSLNATFFGEPFMENGYLYYFDGDIVTLEPRRTKGEINKQSINQTIKKIITKHSPEKLIFWGETSTTEINGQKGYKLDKTNLDLWKRELVFKSADFKPTKKFKYYMGKAKKEELTFNFVKTPYYKSEYMKLLGDTHKNMFGVKSSFYYSVFPSAKEVKYFEVFKDGEMVAMHIVIEALPNYVCCAEVGYKKTFNRISGISGVILINEYLDKAKYISLGGCSTESNFQYKKEMIGKIPLGFSDNYVWYEFYKDKEAKWWLERMQAAKK